VNFFAIRGPIWEGDRVRAALRSPLQGSRILFGIVDSQAWQPGLRIYRTCGAQIRFRGVNRSFQLPSGRRGCERFVRALCKLSVAASRRAYRLVALADWRFVIANCKQHPSSRRVILPNTKYRKPNTYCIRQARILRPNTQNIR